jgi:hypothetical protein
MVQPSRISSSGVDRVPSTADRAARQAESYEDQTDHQQDLPGGRKDRHTEEESRKDEAIPRTIDKHSRLSGLASFPTDTAPATPLNTAADSQAPAAAFPSRQHRSAGGRAGASVEGRPAPTAIASLARQPSRPGRRGRVGELLQPATPGYAARSWPRAGKHPCPPPDLKKPARLEQGPKRCCHELPPRLEDVSPSRATSSPNAVTNTCARCRHP